MILAMAAIVVLAASDAPVINRPDFNQVTVAVPGANESACASAACRAGGNRTVLHFDLGHGSQFVVPRSPYLTEDGSILIYPGEVLLFDFPQATSGSLGRPRFLRTQDGRVMSADPTAAKAPPMLTLSYRQIQVSPNQYEMDLDVRHALAGALAFDSTVSHFTSDNGITLARSASCTLISHRIGTESWPEIVGPVLLSGFRLAEAPGGNAGMSCE